MANKNEADPHALYPGLEYGWNDIKTKDRKGAPNEFKVFKDAALSYSMFTVKHPIPSFSDLEEADPNISKKTFLYRGADAAVGVVCTAARFFKHKWSPSGTSKHTSAH